MPRTATFSKRELGTKKARLKLEAHPRNIAFETIGNRLSVGYRREPGASAGAWFVRREVGRTESGSPMRQVQRIGEADDIRPADGLTVFDYEQARSAAGKWTWPGARERAAGPLTVRAAAERYLEHLKAHKGERAMLDAEGKLDKHVLPALGDDAVSALTLTGLQKWLAGMVRRDKEDPDAERRSKDTVNRVLATFKAALNHAFEDDANGIHSDKAWRALKGFKAVGARREDHFTEAEVATLIDKAREQDAKFADLLEAGFYTGARYGELTALDVQHFDARRAHLHIPAGKTGARTVTLTPEGVEFFKRVADRKKRTDVLLPRTDGERWGKSEQHRRMKAALKAAKLPASASFYTLRHTHISRAREHGQPDWLIADNCGTSVKMIEQVYGKASDKTRRDLIARTGPSLRVVAELKRDAA